MDITIKPVRSDKELKDFIDLPWRVYKDFPHWVPPLKKEVKEILDTSIYPFWQHAERELFIAYKGGEVVGRIAGIIDENHNKFHGEKAGFFGFFECLPDYNIAEKLFTAAKEWCKNKGAEFLRGPANPSSNDEYGFLLEGFDKDPAVMMPYNPPYYLEFSEKFGFKKVKDLYAFLKKAETGIPERIERMMKRILKNTAIKVRPFDIKNFDREVQIIKDIYNSAWEKNWGFVPMTEAEMDFSAKKMKEFFDPRIVLIAEVNGEPVGVSITLPNINEVLKKLNGKLGPIEIIKFLYYRRKIEGCRTLVGGVKEEHRKTGVIAVLFYETAKRAIEAGYKWCELSWNLEDNDLINRFDSEIGGVLYKKYRLYQMPLS
jgi:GNAT superfamily N-acetyltransferase